MNAVTETEVAKAAVVILADTETHGDLQEYDRHPSLHRLVRSGYEVVTF